MYESKLKAFAIVRERHFLKNLCCLFPIDLSPAFLGPSNDPDPDPEFIWSDQMTFDFERMDVYQLSLTTIDCCMRIIAKMPRGHSGHADQLKRAVTSVSFNTAEGSGEFKPVEKARFYRMALRSVSEISANVQIGNRLKIISHEDYNEAYELFTRLAKMLTKLVASAESRNQIRERDRDRSSGIVYWEERQGDQGLASGDKTQSQISCTRIPH